MQKRGGQNGSNLLHKSIDAQIEFPDFRSFTHVENAIQSKSLPIRCALTKTLAQRSTIL